MTATDNQDQATAEAMRQAEADAQARATHAEAMQSTLDANGDTSDSTGSAESASVEWPSS